MMVAVNGVRCKLSVRFDNGYLDSYRDIVYKFEQVSQYASYHDPS